MPGLRVLFPGGAAIISSACSRLAVERGIEPFVLHRGHTCGRTSIPLRGGRTALARACRPGA